MTVRPRVTVTGAEPTVFAAGSPTDIGRALGAAGRAATHARLVDTRAWQAAAAFVGSDRLAALEAATRRHHPAVAAEIEGLAEGLGLAFGPVFAWACRGDLPGVLWPVAPDAGADGCTTVAWRDGAGGGVLAHNEDGAPALRGGVVLARVEPDDAPAFTAFCYPGSPAGHAFAWTDAGLVQTVNNIRAVRPGLGVPRIVRCRAALAGRTLAEARALLEAGPAAGAFHHLLARPGEGLLGLETAAEGTAADPGGPTVLHANHALWGAPDDQIVTASSAARQARIAALAATTWPSPPAETDLARTLDDRADPAFPVFRTGPTDTDGEATLGRLVARVTADSLVCSATLFGP
ncbi:C45 family autoproteolytic acyltransferase/hydolase [Roseospira goensis]|uniref:Peptidase C45 hydrolase domain-containing protein n=1 Tax=Roseospira goensis TaxID=391922 RepID=A0A7W6WLJ4_9PROT|nr:C45 family peptidase [Roseospira goensis]MBB4287476.1 hypothetical protein [Roseospira goensis]